MNSKNLKKVLSTSIASLTVLSTLSGSVSTKIYAEDAINIAYGEYNVTIKFSDELLNSNEESYNKFCKELHGLADLLNKNAGDKERTELTIDFKDAYKTEIENALSSLGENDNKAGVLANWLKKAIEKAPKGLSEPTDPTGDSTPTPEVQKTPEVQQTPAGTNPQGTGTVTDQPAASGSTPTPEVQKTPEGTNPQGTDTVTGQPVEQQEPTAQNQDPTDPTAIENKEKTEKDAKNDKSLFKKISEAISGIFKRIKNWFTSTFNAIKKFFSKNN